MTLTTNEIRSLIYAPGEFRCPKCGFVLSQFRLHVPDGTIGERDDPGEHCPNDGSPLWRVTWKDRAGEHFEHAVEEMNRAKAAEARIAELTTALEPFAQVAKFDIGDDEHDDDTYRPMREHNIADLISVGDLRRARTALSAVSNGEG